MSLGMKSLAQCLANKPGAAGDENMHAKCVIVGDGSRLIMVDVVKKSKSKKTRDNARWGSVNEIGKDGQGQRVVPHHGYASIIWSINRVNQ